MTLISSFYLTLFLFLTLILPVLSFSEDLTASSIKLDDLIKMRNAGYLINIDENELTQTFRESMEAQDPKLPYAITQTLYSYNIYDREKFLIGFITYPDYELHKAIQNAVDWEMAQSLMNSYIAYHLKSRRGGFTCTAQKQIKNQDQFTLRLQIRNESGTTKTLRIHKQHIGPMLVIKGASDQFLKINPLSKDEEDFPAIEYRLHANESHTLDIDYTLNREQSLLVGKDHSINLDSIDTLIIYLILKTVKPNQTISETVTNPIILAL